MKTKSSEKKKKPKKRKYQGFVTEEMMTMFNGNIDPPADTNPSEKLG